MKHFIVINESPIKSVVADTYTFLLLGLMIYLSNSDTLWTIFSMVCFLIAAFTKSFLYTSNSIKKFNSAKEAVDWLSGVGE